MTTFLDGPAAGQTLMLKRAAYFLRVTQCGVKFDALDQPEDSPNPDEKLFAYVITAQPSTMHLNAGRGRSGFYAVAEYRLAPVQPPDEVLRDNDKWGQWCRKQEKPNL